MTNLVVYSPENDAIHKSGASVLLHQPTMVAELLVQLAGLGACVRDMAAGGMSTGAIRHSPIDWIFNAPSTSRATSTRYREARRRAFFLFDRVLLFRPGFGILLEQLFAPSQPFLKVLIWPPSLARWRWRTRRTFYVCLVCTLIVTSIEKHGSFGV